MTSHSQLPNLGDLLLPLLKRVPLAHQPLFIAIAERAAADRYRGWARDVGSDSMKTGLLVCSEREIKIATLIEALFPDASAIEIDIASNTPELADTSLFSQFPIEDQFVMQAQGERLGAQMWRSFAVETKNVAAHDAFLECAELEEENAIFLESIRGSGL